MSSPLKLSDFQQQVADLFDNRTQYDEEDSFHPQLAHRLIELAKIQPGQQILDLATGTGFVAIEAANLVGNEGRVIGIDISQGMLEQARKKAKKADLKNLELLQADAETLQFPDNYFDRILCCSALPYFQNIPACLNQWRRFLKPQGIMGLAVFSETSFIVWHVLNRVGKKYGIVLPNPNEATGTVEKCEALLKAANFQTIEIYTEQFGSYLSLSHAQKMWEGSLKNPLCRPFLQINPQELAQAKLTYFAELETLATDPGIWNDAFTFFVICGC